MSLFRVFQFITSHPINRSQRLSAVKRFLKWQISSRLAPGAIAHDWLQGARFLVRTGDTGLTGNIYSGLHEFPDMGYLLHVLRPEDAFVDVGANLGSYTILAGAVVGARGYAFEPVPQTWRKLVENIRLNQMEARVQAFNLGLAQAEGVMRFTTGLDTINHVMAPADASTLPNTEVKVSTLDLMLAGVSPRLMKIDVEGFETPVLKGAEQTLADPRLHSLIMELNGSGGRYGFDESAIIKSLLQAGFQPHAYDPFTRALTSLHGKNQQEGNTIFVRDLDFVRERIASAPRYDVLGVQI